MGSNNVNKLENGSGYCSDGGTSKRDRRKNYKSKAKILHACSDCGFESKRQYNVIRHYERIHKPLKRPITCCGEKYSTKGEFYQHCADKHPKSNRASLVSKTKYKITGSSGNATIRRNKKNTKRRRSLRNFKPKIEVDKRGEDDNVVSDEDTPLINYVNTPRLRRKIKKENKFVKLIKKGKKKVDQEIIDQQKLDDNSVDVSFKGDITSGYHTEIQREFLRDIDFQSFQLV